MDGGAWWAAVHGVAKSRTRLSNFTFTFHFHALEKEMVTHSSVLACKIPGMGEPWWAAVYGVAQSQTQLRWLSSSSSNTPLYVYPAFCLSFFSLWTLRLLPLSGHCEDCCYEQSVWISAWVPFSILLGIFLEMELVDYGLDRCMLNFWGTAITFSIMPCSL